MSRLSEPQFLCCRCLDRPSCCKIRGAVNPTDLMTKHLGGKR